MIFAPCLTALGATVQRSRRRLSAPTTRSRRFDSPTCQPGSRHACVLVFVDKSYAQAMEELMDLF